MKQKEIDTLMVDECVLCKECKHSDMHNNLLKIQRYCKKLCRFVPDDFYCAYRER